MQRIIKCTVSGEYIRGSGVVAGAAGSHDDVVLELTFKDVWLGTTKTAFWHDARGENPVAQVLTLAMMEGYSEGEYEIYRLPIPAEAKAFDGEAKLTLRGVIIDDGIEAQASVSADAFFEILPGSVPDEFKELMEVSPSAAEQLQEEIEGIKDGITKAVSNSAQALDLSEKNASDIEVLKQSGGGKGEAGEDGFSPIAKVTQTSSGATITITDKTGTTTATVTNGKDGANGKNGADGVNGKDGEDGKDGKDGRGIKSIARTSGNGSAGTTDTYTITYTDNTTSTFTVYNGANGKTPVKGTDYFTTADINEIVNAVYVKIADGNEVAY